MNLEAQIIATKMKVKVFRTLQREIDREIEVGERELAKLEETAKKRQK